MSLNQLQLSLQFARFAEAPAHRAVLSRSKVTRWIRHALAVDAEITVRIVDAEEGQQLNREYRQKDYATHLLVHGTLHAQGWDHETSEQDAEEMEAYETEIMVELGFADPYAK
jgi:probable rRNA maturation factor